jgi:RNA ligase
MTARHLAHTMPFDELIAGLRAALADGHVVVQNDGPLSLWTYSRSAVYERVWTPFTQVARGLILNEAEKRIVATPLPKFYNYGERDEPIPDLPFEVFEKLDGSLGIIFNDGLGWRVATKGSFNSDQAKWAQKRVDELVARMVLPPQITYLVEIIFNENRIVVPYDYEGLVLLASYDDSGIEASYDALKFAADIFGWRLAKRYDYQHISELIAIATDLPATEEGFVLRFSNGHRLKIKGDQYRRIHAMVSRVTPLAIWEMMQVGDDLSSMRKEIPEEFWADFDTIVELLNERIGKIIESVAALSEKLAHLSDKELGLMLSEIPDGVRSFIFPYRNYGSLTSGKTRQSLFRAIRPTGNQLDGYRASSSMNRVMDDV